MWGIFWPALQISGFHAGGACPEAELWAVAQLKAGYYQLLGVTAGRSGVSAGRKARVTQRC